MGRIAVVGAGAAGLMAAGKAGENGHEVFLFEKNERVGKKLLISGKGRCNITNSTDIGGLIENVPGNGNFLYSAFYNFSNTDIMDFFSGKGLDTKIERGGRVFPVTDNARDVVKVLHEYIADNGVKLMTAAAVKEVTARDGRVTGVRLNNGSTFDCTSIIITTGGQSYPGTGSTGDGYDMAKRLGHTITPLRPSLVPLVVREKFVKELEGLSLKNIEIGIYDSKGGRIYTDFGEMLFTGYGVSGPVILSASRHVLDYGYKDVKLSIDLKPALNEETLDNRLLRDFKKFSRKQFKNCLDDLLPRKMIPVIVSLSDIPPDKPVNQLTKEDRRKLIRLIKNLKFEICGSRPINEAIITAGGVCTDEINPSTMESRIIKGLFFAGEIIDVDAYTGGYNLTIAFSTGRLAGQSCR